MTRWVMAESIKESRTNVVDDVLQNYMDQLLLSGIEAETPAVATPPDLQPVEIEPPITTPPSKVSPPPAPTRATTETEPTSALASRLVSRLREAEPAVMPTVTPALTIPDVAEAVTEAVEETEVEVQEDAQEATAQQVEDLTQPDWQSAQGVDCLIFKVAGLKLAIPLSLLGGVHNASDDITPLFGQAKWSLGVWQSELAKLTVVDSAQLIMPERNISLKDEGYQFLIQLDRSGWALACQEICDTQTLNYDSVKWRSDASKRPWLAGTVIAEMCALIDVPGMMQLLEANLNRRT